MRVSLPTSMGRNIHQLAPISTLPQAAFCQSASFAATGHTGCAGCTHTKTPPPPAIAMYAINTAHSTGAPMPGRPAPDRPARPANRPPASCLDRGPDDAVNLIQCPRLRASDSGICIKAIRCHRGSKRQGDKQIGHKVKRELPHAYAAINCVPCDSRG